MSDDNEPVVFLMPDGTEVSNDPRFFQREMVKQLAEQQAHVRTATETRSEAGPVPLHTGGGTVLGNGEATPVSRDDLVDEEAAGNDVSLPDNFEELKGKELQSLARDLKSKGVEIDTAGVTKVGDLREAIRTGVENHDPNAEPPELDDDES